MIPDDFPLSWRQVLHAELTADYFQQLAAFVAAERAAHQVFPPADEVWTAFQLTPYEEVRVVILGQDPYHDVGQAHGLCFSVRRGVKPPKSLANIFTELANDLGCPLPTHGNLEAWARQGVFLLNTLLTVRAHQPLSHRGRGWERFTDCVIRKLSDRPDGLVFVLWGAPAQAKEKLIDTTRHVVIKSAHPSPLSAARGFFGSKPFSRVNAALRQWGKPEIDWRL